MNKRRRSGGGVDFSGALETFTRTWSNYRSRWVAMEALCASPRACSAGLCFILRTCHMIAGGVDCSCTVPPKTEAWAFVCGARGTRRRHPSLAEAAAAQLAVCRGWRVACSCVYSAVYSPGRYSTALDARCRRMQNAKLPVPHGFLPAGGEAPSSVRQGAAFPPRRCSHAASAESRPRQLARPPRRAVIEARHRAPYRGQGRTSRHRSRMLAPRWTGAQTPALSSGVTPILVARRDPIKQHVPSERAGMHTAGLTRTADSFPRPAPPHKTGRYRLGSCNQRGPGTAGNCAAK